MKKLIIILILVGLSAGVILLNNSAFAAATTKGKKGLLPLGGQAPDFKLMDVVTGKMVLRDDFSKKKALLVIFMCRHCPFVQHDKEGIIKLAKDYSAKDVAIVGISANDPAAYPQDSPESLKEMVAQDALLMPLLFDDTQGTAKAYTAVATPDFFLFDKDRKLVYRGQFDDSRPGNSLPVTGKDLRKAIDAVLKGKPLHGTQRPAVGCSIKWKKGNEPAYF